MDEADRRREQGADPSFWTWLRFWVQLAVLAAAAIFGAFAASAGGPPGNYPCGLMLAAAALLLIVMTVRRRLDGAPEDPGAMLLVDDMSGLALVIPLFTIAALAGLVLASAYGSGPFYRFGLGLFGASAVGILVQIKHVFDRRERGGR